MPPDQKPDSALLPKLTGETLTVEVRVREVDEPSDGLRGGDSRAAAGEGWIVRGAVLSVVLLVAGIYTGMHIGRGWVPADDGTLSQSALRVMQGQLPHRDFGEIYTGGLSFIHALAFRVFGVNLMSLRICVFLFFLAWLPAVYYIALRFTTALGAGAVALLAVAWSYPNYPAAMPSWYNLFFATFGAAALLRYLDVRTRRWLVVAGICGGVSILIKVIGAYYVAGALLFLAFLEQSESSERDCSGNNAGGLTTNWFYRIFISGGLLLFLAILFSVLRTRLGATELYQFVLPSTVVVGLLFLGEASAQAGSRQRFRTMFHLLLPFLCGLLGTIIIFLLPYAPSAAMGRFVSGVGTSAVSRVLNLDVIRPVGLEKIIFALPLLGVIAAAMYWEKFQGKVVGAVLGLSAAVLAMRANHSVAIFSGIWWSVAALTPITVLLGAAIVWSMRNRDGLAKIRRQQIVLLISLTATCTLVQFPFAAPIYLSYAVPLTLLALLAIVSSAKTQRGTYALASVVGLYLAFGVVSLVPHYIYEITYAVGHMDAMREPRAGGLKIDGATFFDELSVFLRAHSPNGVMFAGNDCPELYFLSGLKSVIHDDSGGPPQIILEAIKSDDLNLVVINDSPYFPGAVIGPEVRAEVRRRFPHMVRFGAFEVFWKQ